MASGSATVMEEDELKGDGKKRKFKPLEAVRKFFGKGKRKGKEEQVSVVAVKAKSTTALHDDDDDDDGGFKNRQPRPLGGNLSISEDSIFSPDQQREPNLQALKKAAVSEESLPKSAFQAELFTKLSKRRSQYSDEDDGLPHSPTPPVTTADIIMGGPLKPLPAAGKSTSRESDNSLISNDASDNEEDDPFQSQWKSSVPSKVSKKPGEVGGAEAPIDFENLSQTELLKSDIAKDRISIKPRSRKTNRQSRKKREGQSPHSLPSLNEESPPKSRSERASTSSVSESWVDSPGKQESSSVASRPPSSPVEKTGGVAQPHPALVKTSAAEPSPTTRRPVSASFTTSMPPAQQEKKEVTKDDDKRASLKSDLKSPTWKEADKERSVRSSPTQKEDVKEASVKVEVRSSALKEDEKRASLKSDLKSPTVKTSVDMAKSHMESESRSKILSSSKTMESLKKGNDLDSLSSAGLQQSGSVMSKSMIVVGSSKSSVGSESSSSVSAKPKVEFLSSGMKPSDSPSSSQHPALHPDSKPAQVTSSVVKPPSAADRTSSPATSKPSAVAASPGESRKDGLRQTDSQTSPAFSPKDDYKLRRQSRSKTLPDQPTNKEEPFAARVQRTASHRAEPTSSQNASPEASPRHRQKAGETSKAREPEWFALARRKTGRQESEEKDSPSPTGETAPGKEATPAVQGSVSSTPDPKEEPVSKAVETSSNVTVSSASARFGENKPSEMLRFRGGSVKTSPTKTHAFANRGSSVKVPSARVELAASANASVTASASVKTSTISSTSASSASGAKQEEVKEEPKGSESPLREVPKWKTQSVKTPSAFSSSSSSSAVSSSRFSNVKPSSQTAPAPLSSTTSAKTETKPASSPAKTALTKTPSEEKDKASVPAWRANLSQKKPVPSDIKIELIETPSSKPSTSSAGGSKEESAKKEESTKKEEPATKVPAASKEVQPEQCRSSATPTRTSKVMNLLKNFENVQGVS